MNQFFAASTFRTILQIIVLSFFEVMSFLTFAQSTAVDWLNKNARELTTDSLSADQELSFLSEEIKNKTIIGLGEASHGTQEFYFQKRRIIKYLVSRENFRIIAFESPVNYIEPVNRYVQTGQGNLKDILGTMALYNTSEIFKLFEWLKMYNETQSGTEKVKVVGFDHEGYWNDPFTRDEFMAGDFIKAQDSARQKSILWSHNLHLAKDTTMAQYKAMGYHLRKHYGAHYYAVGFDTYSGSVSVLNNGQFESHDFQGKENTLSATFSKVKFPAFFIDFREAPKPMINTANTITNLLSNWQEPKPLPIIPGLDFDAMIFIRNTTASRMNE
ncbi:erythromycin esterase family protein [Dyadobacter sp. LJ53]|uniref:erythromycin esterase family protein n=1 Tax=Dyadobacter chenwenxiniae TaxID=2906456 RepID=UPI001F3E51F1|nr:erythromycin esterase family protein [Dyadobacter chenwenxiniae]MCF0050485.1 erythromycin esterase family protein [Dyadobacter chenwenxiniae]